MRRVFALLLFSLALPAALPAAAPAPGLWGRYLLAFARCEPGADRCSAVLVQSRDGIRFAPIAGLAARPGERPSTVRRGATLYLFDAQSATGGGFGGSLRRFQIAPGRLVELPPATESVQLTDLREPQQASTGSFASSFVVDEAGALVVFYGIRLEQETNACPVAGRACVKLRTASELPGSDGTSFAGDRGNRAVVSFAPGEQVGGPAIFRGPSGYVVLLAGPEGCLTALAAKDVRGSYRASVSCLARGVSSPSGFYNPRLREFWLYGESGGQVVRAVATRLDRPLRPGAFRPLAALGSSIRNPSFAVNAS